MNGRPSPSRAGAAYATLISAVAALGGFLFGYDTAVVNGTIGALERHFAADAGRLGFAVASALLGSTVGALIGGRVITSITGIINILTTFFVLRLVPETKGRALEEM